VEEPVGAYGQTADRDPGGAPAAPRPDPPLRPAEPPPPPNGEPPRHPPEAGMPATGRAHYLSVIYPPVAGRVDAVILSDWALGWPLHWFRGRTFPHWASRDQCEGCRMGQLPRWTAWVHGLVIPTQRPYIVMISSEGWLGCPDLIARQGQLRGVTISLRRRGPSRQSPVQCLVLGTRAPAGLPPATDVRISLSRYWGYHDTWLTDQIGPDPAGRWGPSPPEGGGR
jgi:hypothetical protein